MSQLPLTGYAKLDVLQEDRRKRAPRSTLTGLTLVKDPTETANRRSRVRMFDEGQRSPLTFIDIDKAYNVDSFVRQGVDKYVELITKQGHHLDCETPEPVQYLHRRLQIMAHVSDKGFERLVHELALDVVKYSNAFWVKKRQLIEHPLMPKEGVGGKLLPVAGYFRADPKRMTPRWSQDGSRLLGWYYEGEGRQIYFPKQDIIHFAINVQAGDLWGSPVLGPVLEDVRAYRQCEEYVIKLLFKHLHPLLHHEIADTTGFGYGRQEDIDAALAIHQVTAPDGLLITPPGHKIQMIGAESNSLRGEGYIAQLKARVYAGLGVNLLVMGEGQTVTTGSADVMTVNMHNRAKHIQRQLGELLTQYVLTELLLEGGYDPLDPMDYTQWFWEDIETESRLARENHIIQLWSNNLLTEEEARRALGFKPIPPELAGETFVYKVKIPELEAAADAKAAVASASGSQKQSASRARPSNQHGVRSAPKIRPT